jgi:glycosyltransferase involved in cell wall biosynthesis
MVYSIEKPQTDYSELRDVLDEEVIARIKFLELPQEEKMENKLFRGLRFFESILFDVREAGIKNSMHLGVLRRGRYKYQPKLAYFRDLLLEHFGDYDIVHMGAWYGLYTYAASKLKGVLDFRAVVHSIYHDASFGVIGWKTCREILSRVDAVTTSTAWEEKTFKDSGLLNVYFVGEGVDIVSIERETSGMPVEEKTFTVIFVGAKNHGKGYYHALLAMNKFAKNVGYNNVRMICIGRGSLLGVPSSLQKNVFEAYRELKWHGCLEDYTFASEREKLRHLKRAHLVLLPSKAETIPLVTLEGWALGKPSILCSLPTVKSVIGQSGNGAMLVDYGDVNGMVRKLEDFYKKPDLLSSVSLRGRNILMEYGSLKAVSARLLGVYEKILGLTG